jgi:hypothetical protein
MRSLVFRIEGETCVFDNKVRRKACGPTKDEETGEYKRLHNEQIHSIYFGGETLMKETTWKA